MHETSLLSATDRKNELKRIVRTAALTISPEGNLRPLCEKAGLNYPALMLALRRGYFTPGQACALELAVPDLLKKEILCPETYAAN